MRVRFFVVCLVTFGLLLSNPALSQCPPANGGSFSGNNTIPNGTDCVVNGNLTLSNKSLTIIDGGSLTINGNFTNSSSNGGIVVNGTLTINGNFINQSNADLSSSGVMKVTGNLTFSGNNPELNLSGGLSVGGTADFQSNKPNATITVQDGGVFQAQTLTTNSTFTVAPGGTIYVPTGVPTGVINNSGPDTDCTNNCCGAQCTPDDGNGGGGDALSGTGNEALPIDLLEFNVTLNDNAVDLRWVSATELNNEYYEVERAVSGSEFTVITRIDGAGTSNAPLSYYYKDFVNFHGIVYYRLKQTDFDGHFEYFKIKAIDASSIITKQIRCIPNKTQAGSRVRLIGLPNTDDKVDIRLVDLSGKISVEISLEAGMDGHSFVTPSLPHGIYLIVSDAYGLTIRQRLIISN